MATLQDFNVTEGSNLQLMRILLSVNVDTPYRNIIFRLEWQRPWLSRKVFLDASCLVYNGAEYQGHVDFKRVNAVAGTSRIYPSILLFNLIWAQELTTLDQPDPVVLTMKFEYHSTK